MFDSTAQAKVLPVGWRLAVLGGAQLTMVANMHILLELLEPEPNGFRLSSAGVVTWFTVATLLPVLPGARRVPWTSTVTVGVIQALSPFLLIGVMSDPTADLSFAVILWWLPLPLVSVAVVVLDRHARSWRARQDTRSSP